MSNEHICMNCKYFQLIRSSFGSSESGNCSMLTKIKKDSCEIEQDFISQNGLGKDGLPIRQGSVISSFSGVAVGINFGEDCKYFENKNDNLC